MIMCMLFSATSTHFKWELMLYCLHCPTLNKVFLLLLLLFLLKTITIKCLFQARPGFTRYCTLSCMWHRTSALRLRARTNYCWRSTSQVMGPLWIGCPRWHALACSGPTSHHASLPKTSMTKDRNSSSSSVILKTRSFRYSISTKWIKHTALTRERSTNFSNCTKTNGCCMKTFVKFILPGWKSETTLESHGWNMKICLEILRKKSVVWWSSLAKTWRINK